MFHSLLRRNSFLHFFFGYALLEFLVDLVNTTLLKMAILVAKDFTAAKKLPPVGHGMMITGTSPLPVRSVGQDWRPADIFSPEDPPPVVTSGGQDCRPVQTCSLEYPPTSTGI